MVGNASRGPRTEARASRKFYSDRNAKVVSRQVNDDATALNRLEQAQVRRPPEVLRFAGLAPGTSTRGLGARSSDSAAGTAPVGTASAETSTGPTLTATQLHLEGRLAPTSLSLGPSSSPVTTGGFRLGGYFRD